MTNPTPDPLALAEEAERHANTGPLRTAPDCVYIRKLVTALRAAHEENQRDKMVLRLEREARQMAEDGLKAQLAEMREAVGEMVAAMERYENEAEGDAPQSHLDMMVRVRKVLAGGKGMG